jgi:hypothetical protein
LNESLREDFKEILSTISAANSQGLLGNTTLRVGTTQSATTKAAIRAAIMGNTNSHNQPNSMHIFIYDSTSQKLVGEFLSLRKLLSI